MKNTHIWYWVCTGIFAAFITFSAVPNILSSPDSMVFIGHLGYPDYFVPFIGVAKLLGCIALIIPGFPKIREWAYAGLFFDLLGAVYSLVMVDGFDPGLLMMIPVFGIGTASYLLNRKVYQVG